MKRLLPTPECSRPFRSHYACFWLATLAIAIFLSNVVQAQTDDDVIAIESSLVVANVYITDRSGEPVSGLQQKLFTILEDGVPQKIDIFTAESTPFAAVILIDTSGSMEYRVSNARSAAIKFLEGLRGEDFAAVASFDNEVHLLREFLATRDLPDVFFDLKPDGMTSLNDAVVEAAKMLAKRPEKRRAIIVISDGADNSSKYSQKKAMKAVLDVGASVYTVDMSPKDAPPQEKALMQDALKSFAEKTGGTFVATPGGAEMRHAFESIVAELGNQYTIGYQPASAKEDGKFHSIEVRVARGGLKIRTREGYIAPKRKR
ncbi:MAG TPA: VWA domain-containing protein [Pyrinomonadaceae bacterium]|nr:VWA domain-containing protein [Pyrinomonadaceae bacterium]